MNGAEPGASGIIRGWWQVNIADRQSSAARRLRARLCRGSALEALSEGPVFRLARALATEDAQRIYRLVRVLAAVEADDAQPLARRLGAGDPPTLSQLRFQRLIRADHGDLTVALVRAVPLAGDACNFAALGPDLFFWSDRVRTRWTFQYFGAGVPEALRENAN